MTDEVGPEPRRRRLTMRQLAASYSPRRFGDFIFLHGLARIAARQALRDDERLYVPREWERAHGTEAIED